jgi:hypothetical protein
MVTIAVGLGAGFAFAGAYVVREQLRRSRAAAPLAGEPG